MSKHEIQPEYGQGKEKHFTCSAAYEQGWQPCPVDPYAAIIRDDQTHVVASPLRRELVSSGCFLRNNLNASRPSEHPPVRGGNVKTFRWDHRLQIQNLFMAFKRVPRR